MDFPLFGDASKKRREINLGGTTAQISHASILEEARARRQERDELRRKEEGATKIQSWWRGRRQADLVRQQLRETCAQDVTSLVGLRCLVLVGNDDALLGRWSSAMMSAATSKSSHRLLHAQAYQSFRSSTGRFVRS